MHIDTGDTTFILISTALVLLMIPGLALLYGGLVRKKNVLNTIMYSLIAIIILSLEWVLIGYTLTFGPDKFGIIGDLSWLGLHGVGFAPNDYAPTIPALTFMSFQMMFAIIIPAIVSGSIVERMSFGAYMLFIFLWGLIPYNLAAHWVWGKGWLSAIGVLDFAGGTVAHILAGFSGLVAALVVGKRSDVLGENNKPHNLPMVVLGAGILWAGWLAFNGGSALGANEIAAIALVNTQIAGAAGGVAWLLVEKLITGKISTLGLISGALAGLVSITPAAGFVTPMASIIIAFAGGLICYYAVTVMKPKFGYDDTLDVFGIHGICGTWGMIATGLFATTSINPNGSDGLFYGNASLLSKQLIALGTTAILAMVSTYIILKVVSLIIPLRVTSEVEEAGLDVTIHGEVAYH